MFESDTKIEHDSRGKSYPVGSAVRLAVAGLVHEERLVNWIVADPLYEVQSISVDPQETTFI